jgi:hypothetical protein
MTINITVKMGPQPLATVSSSLGEAFIFLYIGDDSLEMTDCVNPGRKISEDIKDKNKKSE